MLLLCPKGEKRGHAVTVNVSPPSTNGGTGKTYQKEVLTNGENGGIIKKVTASNGVIVKYQSEHASERCKERGITRESIHDALINPLYIGDVKADSMGRKSQRFIGESATVNVNPETGIISTVWKTGKDTAKKYKRGNKNDKGTN